MIESLGIRVAKAQAVKAILDAGATFQVWAGTVPGDATSAPGGTMLASGSVAAGNVTVNTGNAQLAVAGLSDTQIDATGIPTFVRLVDPSGNIQLTAKMASNNAAGIEVVITDSTDAAATQMLQNRAFNASMTIQY